MSYGMNKLVVALLAPLGLLLTVSLLLSGDTLADGARLPDQPQAIITPTSGFVLYSRYDGVSHLNDTIWLMDAAGDNEMMDGMYPRLSPNGRYIVYKKGHSQQARSDVYVRDLQTGLDTKVITNTDFVVSYWWTFDSARIVVDFMCDIYIVDRDGANLQEFIADWPSSSQACWNDSPALNPVDGRVAWENEHYGLGVADADGSNPAWIPNTKPYDYTPIWSPDGAWIAFWRDDNLFKIHPDGTGLMQLTFRAGTNDDYMDNTGAWTASSEWLIAPAKVNAVDGLYAVATDGSGKLVPVAIRELACNDWVGSAGDVDFWQMFLPLALRN